MIAAKHFLFAFGMFVILVASGCSGCSKQPRHAVLEWSEPVQLASGETVQIKRNVEMWHETAFGGGFSSAPVYKTNSIELDPATSEFPKWDTPLVPIVMDKDPSNGEWVVVASIDECGMWARNGRPQPPYWAFRLQSREWFRVEIPQWLLNRRSNLFVEYDTVDSSEELNSEIAIRKRSQIDDPKHSTKYSSVEAARRFEHCDSRPSKPVGVEELDLGGFRRLP